MFRDELPVNPQNVAITEPIYPFSATYNPKFPYVLEYNLNLQREIAPGIILNAGCLGARGNHLTREAEQNPFLAAEGHRYNPNLPSPLLGVLTDAQSFYNSFQFSVSKHYAHGLSWQAFYTFSHSVDDASMSLNVEAVNEPPTSQDIFNRKGSRGQDSTAATISWRTWFMNFPLEMEATSVAGRSRLWPAFTATSLSLRCLPLTTQMCSQ